MTNAGRAWVAAAVSVLLIGGFLATDALDDEEATGGTLAGTRWVVTEMEGVALVPDALPSVGFAADEGRPGRGGCNSVGGDYTASGSTISVGSLFQTLAGCAAPIACPGGGLRCSTPGRHLLHRGG